MNIVQQPDSLCFAGNVLDFVIDGVTKSITFKLRVDNVEVVNEVYTPSNGRVDIRCKDIVNHLLSVSIPRADQDHVIQSSAVKKFRAEIDTTVVEFTAVKGGISNVIETSSVFLKTQFLTLQPQQKNITTHQPEYLSYYAVVAGKVKVKAYHVDGSDEKYILDIVQGNLYTIDLSYLKISGKFNKAIGCYDVWVEDTGGNRLTYMQRYILTRSNVETNVYMFENTLGGIDTVTFTGKFTEKIQTEGTVTTMLEESLDNDVDLNFSREQNTGFIPSIEYARWLRGFFVSKQRYHVSGSLRRIYLRESDNEFTVNSLNDFVFEFFYSIQEKYDVVTRDGGELPELLEFPEVDDQIPFLVPRLSEFPIAVTADDLMLPVQYAYENKWRRISVASILGKAVDDAVGNIDLSNYWSKSEIEVVERYLTVLGEKIKAAFSDDSELWSGHHFRDYLNQFLLTTSDVMFNSITHPDFESKVKGWMIDALGDAEFRNTLVNILTFNEITTPDFVSGLLGSGARLKDSHLELNEITVRQRMNVFQLVIQKVMHQGGILILSPGGAEITSVVDGGTYYKCTFDTKNGKLKQPFVVDDQLLSQSFDEGNMKRYWRRVTSTGNDYFNLSKTDCEVNSGIPAVGDEVVVLGNKTDVNRQSAMILCSVGANAPYMDTYDGINTFSLEGKLRTREGSLSGIVDEVFGQLDGTGLYAKNVYLRGKFALSTGITVEDKFGQTDSKLSSVEGQLNTQQGVISDLKTEMSAVPGKIEQSVSGVINWTKEEIANSVAKTVTVTAPVQVFKYVAGYTGTPSPANIVLSVIVKSFTPTSYQWQFLNGSAWTNIPGATGTTYSVTPGNTTLFPSGETVRSFRCVCDGDEKLSDVFTLAKLADGATGATGGTGATGKAGEDACTVLLTNETHTIACDANGTPLAGELAKATTKVVAYKGSSEINFVLQNLVTVGGTFVLDGTDGVKCTALSSDSGGCTFEVKIGSVIVKKVFGVTKSKTGEKGDTGATGKGITSVVEQYYLSTSSTIQSGGSWVATVPGWVDGKYIWTRSIITYTDGSTTTTTPVCVTGGKGSTGAIGVGISTVDVLYYLSTSATSLAGGSWVTTAPAWVSGKYMWSKTRVTLSNGITNESAAACITGATGGKGDKGDAGKGVQSVVPQYYLSTSSTTQTGGSWSPTVPAWTSGKYIWTRFVTTYTDNSTTTTAPVYDIANKAVDVAYSKVEAGINNLATGITIFAKQTDFNSLGTRVSRAEASITTNASNIELKVSKDGVVSAINASPESVKISAAKIELVGKVTFSMFDTNAQSTINGKVTSAQATTIATTQVNTLKNSLGSLAYLSNVEKAQLGTTIIIGGYIKTDLLDVDNIFAKQAAIGGFSIGSDRIGSASSVANPTTGMSLYDSFIKFRNSSVLATIGINTIASSTGFGVIAARFEIATAWSSTSPQSNIALKLVSNGHPNTYTDMGRNYALYADDGLIVSRDAIIDFKYYELKNSGPIRVDQGKIVMLNLPSLMNVYLPTLTHVRKVLFLDSTATMPFMIKISIFVWSGSARIYPSSGCTFYNRNGAVITYFSMVPGEAIDVCLWSGGGNFVANVIGYAG